MPKLEEKKNKLFKEANVRNMKIRHAGGGEGGGRPKTNTVTVDTAEYSAHIPYLLVPTALLYYVYCSIYYIYGLYCDCAASVPQIVEPRLIAPSVCAACTPGNGLGKEVAVGAAHACGGSWTASAN